MMTEQKAPYHIANDQTESEVRVWRAPSDFLRR